jgi:hypothetical protein
LLEGHNLHRARQVSDRLKDAGEAVSVAGQDHPPGVEEGPPYLWRYALMLGVQRVDHGLRGSAEAVELISTLDSRADVQDGFDISV